IGGIQQIQYRRQNRIFRGGDDPRRLVHYQVCISPVQNGLIVDGHRIVLRVHVQPPVVGRNAVDRYPPRLDQLFHVFATAPSRVGQQLVQTPEGHGQPPSCCFRQIFV